jgi:hypothetical protein
MPNRVTVRLRDGSERKETVIVSTGSPERPLSMSGVAEKARALLAMVDPAIDLDRIVAGVEALPAMKDAGSFAETLTIKGYPAEGRGAAAA